MGEASTTGGDPVPGRGRTAGALLVWGLLLLTSALGASGPARALDSPIVSGLPWRSGSSCPEKGLGAFRGRALDVNVAFAGGHETWDAMLAHFGGRHFGTLARATPQFVVTLPMLPKSERGQLARCAAGAFDGRFREFGSLFGRIGAGRAVVRLGWEANKTRPWTPAAAAEIPDYVACFRRGAAALKAGAPGLTIEWTVGRISNVPFSPMDMYPGDDAVDQFGVHYYDNVAPKISTQAAWDQHYRATYRGGPAGLGAWLEEARAHGKRLAVSEWGVWDQGSVAAADNPVYVENMRRFFEANAADLAYENYYSCPLAHQLHPSTKFPKAAGEYRELW